MHAARVSPGFGSEGDGVDLADDALEPVHLLLRSVSTMGIHYTGVQWEGVPWIGVVLYNELVYNIIYITTPCFRCTPPLMNLETSGPANTYKTNACGKHVL